MSSGKYKVYAGDGNNGQLVIRLLKNRGLWAPTEDINEAHLCWTQLPPKDLMNQVESSDLVKFQK